MAISMIHFSQKLFSLLSHEAKRSERCGTVDEARMRLNFSEEEKDLFSSIKNTRRIEVDDFDFVLSYSCKKGEKYLIVSKRLGYAVDPLDKELVFKQPSLVDLGVLFKENLLSVAEDVNPDAVLNAIEIYEDNEDYEGNTYDDISCFFPQFSVYQVNADSKIADSNDEYCLYAYYLIKCHRYGYSNYVGDTLNLYEKTLLSQLRIPYRNIASALSSTQWAFRFLETYRLIEHMFPITYMSKLRTNGIIGSPIEIAKLLENVIDWRPNEQDAVFAIIEEIKLDPKIRTILIQMKKVIINDNTKIGKWYYTQVRNQIVHYRAIHKNVSFSSEEWNVILQFNLLLIMYLYTKYDTYVVAWNTVSDNLGN